MGWKDDARRLVVSDKRELESITDSEGKKYWIKPRKWSVAAKDEINGVQRRLQKAIDKKALASLVQKSQTGDYETVEEMIEAMEPDEFAALLDTQNIESYDLAEVKLRNGISSHNFCDGDIETRSTDKDIKGFVHDILEYEDIALEILKIVEDYNRPLAMKTSATSKTLPDGSTEESALNTEMSTQTDESLPS